MTSRLFIHKATNSTVLPLSSSKGSQSNIMGCSVSKAKDVGDERVSQRQHGLGIVANTAKEAAAEELILHPAASIFRDEVLAGIGKENAALKHGNSHFRHLRECIQKLNITFSTPTSQPVQVSIAGVITYHQTMKIKPLLSHGSAVVIDDEERLLIPISAADAHPIDDCGVVGVVSGSLAGLPLGTFPLNLGEPKVRVEGDGSVHLTLYLSPHICIDGRLDAHISNDALAAYVEREDFMTFMRLPALLPVFNVQPSQANGITFTPTSISMPLTTHIKKTLSFFSGADSQSNRNEDSADIFRRHVVDALGESEHKDLLSTNLKLKCESAALAGIRNLILGVEVSHSTDSWSVTLDKGEKSTDAMLWHITLHDRENISLSLPVADIGNIGLSFSGMQLRMDINETVALFGQQEAQPISFRLESCPSIYFVMLGIFNWGDFSDDEVSDIAEDLHAKWRHVLEGNCGEDVFPSKMKFVFVEILCDITLADSMLEMVGLSTQPDSDE